MYSKKKYADIDPAAILEKLPGKVTSIQIQARNAKRASVFVEEIFLFGAVYDHLLQFNIQKGSLLDKKTASSLLGLEEKHKLKEYILRLLSRRDHSKQELKQKAINKGHKLIFIDELFEEFEKLNYLNEERFVKSFIREKETLSGWGSFRIKSELRKKGISESVIDLYLMEPDEDALKEQMIILILKKASRFKRESDTLKKKKKIYEHLIRKGYPSDAIMRYIGEISSTV